jgi:hypothetical protein
VSEIGRLLIAAMLILIAQDQRQSLALIFFAHGHKVPKNHLFMLILSDLSALK